VFWIIRSAIRSAGRSRAKSEPKPKGERAPAGALAVLAVFAAMAYVVGTGMLTGHLPAAPIMFAIPVVLGFTILGGTLGKARKSTRPRALDHIPAAPSAADEARKTALMRAQAAGVQFRGDTAARPLPKPPQARPRPAKAKPRVVTRKVIALDAEDDARLLRIAAILVESCPFCGVGEAELCEPVEGYKWYALDRGRGIYAHALRISKALAKGSAKLEDVLAQFDNQMPEELWASII
jgi:hypothetical protein